MAKAANADGAQKLIVNLLLGKKSADKTQLLRDQPRLPDMVSLIKEHRELDDCLVAKAGKTDWALNI